MTHKVRGVLLVHRGGFSGGGGNDKYLTMIGLSIDEPPPASFSDVARNIDDDEDIEKLKQETHAGTYLVLRYVRFNPSFESEEDAARKANQYIRWLGWNNLVWHLRDFSPDDREGATPPSAPVTGFWDDEPLCGSPLADHVCRMVVFLSRELLLDRLRQWFSGNGFVPNRAAPKPAHHINTFIAGNAGLAPEHEEELEFPKVVFIERDKSTMGNLNRLTTGKPPITVMSLDQGGAPGDRVPQQVIDMLKDESLEAGRYALLASHGAFHGKAVETLSTRIEGVRHAVRRATFCVGADSPRELRCVTAWVFERPPKPVEETSPSDTIIGSIRRLLVGEPEGGLPA